MNKKMNSFCIYKQLIFIIVFSLTHSILKAQKIVPNDSLENFIHGSWRLSGDTNVLWVFRDTATAYQYYLNNDEATDTCLYEIKDTCILYGKEGNIKKVKYLLLINESGENKEYYQIIILNNYFMYLRDIAQGRSYDFSKQIDNVIYK